MPLCLVQRLSDGRFYNYRGSAKGWCEAAEWLDDPSDIVPFANEGGAKKAYMGGYKRVKDCQPCKDWGPRTPFCCRAHYKEQKALKEAQFFSEYRIVPVKVSAI